MTVTIASSKIIPLLPNPLPNLSVILRFFSLFSFLFSLFPFQFLFSYFPQMKNRSTPPRVNNKTKASPYFPQSPTSILQSVLSFYHPISLFTSHAYSHLLITVRVSLRRETRTDQATSSRRSCSSVLRYFYY